MRRAAILEDPQSRIESLQQTIRIYEGRLSEIDAKELRIQDTVDQLRMNLLDVCETLLPKAKQLAKESKPALLRLIARTLRTVR